MVLAVSPVESSTPTPIIPTILTPTLSPTILPTTTPEFTPVPTITLEPKLDTAITNEIPISSLSAGAE